MIMYLLAVLVAAPACASPQTTVYVAPSTMIVTVGQTFSVNMEISDVIDLYGWEFTLKWNPTFLDALNVTEGDFLKSGGDTFFWPIMNNTEGYILADCTLIGNISGVNGSGTLATVEFKVKSAGESILDLYDTKLVNSLEQPIVHTSNDGYVTTSKPVGGVNITNVVPSFKGQVIDQAYQTWAVNVTVTVHNNGSVPINCTVTAYYNASTWVQIGTPQNVTNLDPCNTATLTFNWNLSSVPICNRTIKANATTTCGVSDEFVNGQVKVKKLGDVDNSCQVNVIDILLCCINMGSAPPNLIQCDINGDGTVNVIDILLCCINMGPCPPCT